MTRTKFHSEADFIQSVAESKHQYDARRSSMSFEEKLRILVKLQEKAALLDKINIKPWPITEK